MKSTFWTLLGTSLGVLVLSTSCVEIDSPAPVDEDGEPIALPGPFDHYLEIVEISPGSGDVPLRPHISVTFNDYIDDETFRSYAFASLKSGGVQARGEVDYIMTDKTVVWRPWSDLVPGLVYDFEVAEELESATQSPLLTPDELPTYTVRTDAQAVEPIELPNVGWDAVSPIFEARCASCHQDPQWGLNPLTYDSIIGAKSTQTDLFLVRSGDPSDSYLMRKLLWDYADIEYTHQPPAWSEEGGELPRDELRLIEGWIAHGTRRH